MIRTVTDFRKFKRVVGLLIVALMLLSVIMPFEVSAISFSPDFEVYSDSVYLYNIDSQQVIYTKNADKRRPPASLTKVMTAILAMENIDDLQNTMITAEPTLFDEFVGKNASTADFRHNETAPAIDYIYGLMLQSACEAGSILAYHISGGSVSKFVGMMNQKAKELGCPDTNFTNAHGLYDEGQYTTAEDMAKIALHAMSVPGFMEIAGTLRYSTVPTNKHDQPRSLLHTVKMLDPQSKYYYSPIKGIKTGTLDESGRCLITSASKDGYNYILVTLGAPQTDSDGNSTQYSFEDHKNIYEWAFKNFKNTTLLSANEEIDEVEVKFSNGDDYVLVSPGNDFSTLWNSQIELSNIQRIVKLDEDVNAPVKKGQRLGSVELQLSGESLAVVDLLATGDVERSLIKYNVHLAKQFLSSVWFKTAIAVGAGLIILYLAMYYAMNRKKKSKGYKSGGRVHGGKRRR